MLARKQIVRIILGNDWAITTSIEDGHAQSPRDPTARLSPLLMCDRKLMVFPEAQCMLQKT